MATCTFVLNNQLFSTFVCEVGRFTAFSGNGPDRNNPSSEAVASNGPIPLGLYHIVDRASGGLLGPIKDFALGRDKWFALYREDGSIDDKTFVDAVQRGQFRLHPLGPRRMSTGCIVLQHPTEFEALRAYLLSSAIAHIPGTSMRTYGTVNVGQFVDTLDRRYRPNVPSQQGWG
jgi:hypothetical protein